MNAVESVEMGPEAISSFGISLFVIAGVLGLIALALAVVALICFITVIKKMFDHDQSVLAIVSIVTTFIGGFGPWIAFIMGWVKVREWELKRTMLWWSGAIIGVIATSILGVILVASTVMVVYSSEVRKAEAQHRNAVEAEIEAQQRQLFPPDGIPVDGIPLDGIPLDGIPLDGESVQEKAGARGD